MCRDCMGLTAVNDAIQNLGTKREPEVEREPEVDHAAIQDIQERLEQLYDPEGAMVMIMRGAVALAMEDHKKQQE